MNIKKLMHSRFMKNAKAISPIFATLILIAIAVIAGIVVYMFTSGTLASMTGSGTAGQEKVAIQAIEISVANGITVYAQSTGGDTVLLDTAIVKFANGTVLDVVTFTDESITTAVTPIDVTLTSGVTLDEGVSYTVTLVSKAGGNFVSQAAKATA